MAGGFDPSRHRVMTDPLAHSGGKYLEITYPTHGDGGWLTRFFTPGYDSVYMSYYIRFDPSWTGMTKLMGLYGSRIDNQWSAFGRAGECPNGTDFFNAFLTTEPGTGDPGNMRFYTYYPDMSREPDGSDLLGTLWRRLEQLLPAPDPDPGRMAPDRAVGEVEYARAIQRHTETLDRWCTSRHLVRIPLPQHDGSAAECVLDHCLRPAGLGGPQDPDRRHRHLARRSEPVDVATSSRGCGTRSAEDG